MLVLWDQQKAAIVAAQFPTPYDLAPVINGGGGLEFPTRIAGNERIQIPESLRLASTAKAR